MGVLATGKDVKWAAKQDSMEPTWPCSKIVGFVMNRTIRGAVVILWREILSITIVTSFAGCRFQAHPRYRTRFEKTILAVPYPAFGTTGPFPGVSVSLADIVP